MMTVALEATIRISDLMSIGDISDLAVDPKTVSGGDRSLLHLVRQ